MQTIKNKSFSLLFGIFTASLFLGSCAGIKTAEAVLTEQTAQAILDGSMNLSIALIFAAIIRGIMNN